MNKIHAGHHRILDFVTVIAFALAPTLLALDGQARLLSYTLACVHLVLTLLTRFGASRSAPVPLRLHGLVEMLVGPVLLIVPFLLGWTGIARNFFLGAGVVIIVVWLLSNYEPGAAS